MYFTHHIRCRTNLKGKKNENLVVFNEQMKKRVFQLVQEEIHVQLNSTYFREYFQGRVV